MATAKLVSGLRGFVAQGWQGAPPVSRGEFERRFPRITGRARNAYLKIGRHFSDERKIRQHLAALASGVGTRGPRALDDVLRRIEQLCGFKGVHTIQEFQGVLPGEIFNTILRRRHPIRDEGAGADHGFQTHRIQWWLIYRRFGCSISGISLSDLYAKLGTPEAVSAVQDPPAPDSVWSALFDNTHRNATSPEFFHAYRVHFPNLLDAWE